MGEIIHQIFQRSLFELGGQSISLLWMLKLLVALITVGLVTRFIKQFLKHRLLAKLGIGGGNREAIATLISLGLGAFGYLIVLQATGIDLSSIAVIIGGLGVGIGFGLQDITKNLLSGLTILVERKLRVGDFVEFDTVEGHITEISIRSTVIRTLAGGEVIIPNAQLAEERITNWSYRDFNGRIEIDVGVAYSSDPVLVTETMLEAAYTLPEVLPEPAPKVIFMGFGDNALNFQLWAWINCIDHRAVIRSNLTFILEYYLRQQNIVIPFPQLDLWMHSQQVSNKTDHEQPSLISKPNRPEPEQEAETGGTLRSWLSQISYFQHFNELQLRGLIEMGFRLRLEANTTLIQQGEEARKFYIVLSGAIGAFYESDQQEKQLFTFNTGQYFGELPLMLGVPYPTTMKAITHTVLFVINATGFERLLRNHPALAAEIARELALRKEVLEGYEKELRAMGMTADSDSNLVDWIQQRLKQLFTSSSSSR